MYYEINWDLCVEIALVIAMLGFLIYGFFSGDV